MPEAPEVQTVLSTLEGQIKNIKIKKVEILYSRLIEGMDYETFSNCLENQSIQSFFRIGKYLGFQTEEYDWICHLRMEGKFYLFTEYPHDKHIHAIFTLEDGRYLCYHDTRKFGRMYLYPKTENKQTHACFKHVGRDFKDCDAQYVYDKIHSSNRPLKTALLDQSIIAGIGNIYADEIAFSCQLHPETKCSHLSLEDCEQIVYHTKRILNGAIQYGGTTIRSYTSSLGVTGRFQLKLKVHQKENELCQVCGSKIEKIKVGQRSTYLCPKCQIKK